VLRLRFAELLGQERWCVLLYCKQIFLVLPFGFAVVARGRRSVNVCARATSTSLFCGWEPFGRNMLKVHAQRVLKSPSWRRIEAQWSPAAGALSRD
jgi:hypothetical protein